MKMNKYFKYVGSTVFLLIVPLMILSKRLEKALPRLSEREGLTFQLRLRMRNLNSYIKNQNNAVDR